MRVAYAKAEERLGDGENDVLITLGADPAPGVTSLKLFSRLNRPVCSPHYLRRQGAALNTVERSPPPTFCMTRTVRAGANGLPRPDCRMSMSATDRSSPISIFWRRRSSPVTEWRCVRSRFFATN